MIYSMRAIDFFCGGGGVTKGLCDAGVDVLAGIELCEDYRETYERNNPGIFICKDIADISEADILEVLPDIQEADDTLFAGCAPCQPFSQQRNSPTEHRDRGLLGNFERIISDYLPAYVFIENVPGIRSKGVDVFQSFTNMLHDNGYDYHVEVVNAKDYGVPQNRRRLVILASRVTKVTFPRHTHGEGLLPYLTVRDAIDRFPVIHAGGNNPNIPNHRAAVLTNLNFRRIQATPHNGGSRTSWPDELVLKCHKKDKAGHTDVYGRMPWDSVAPTLTSKCCSISNGRFGHPEQDRAISFREAASIQTFPDDYVFYGKSDASISRQIGNAVPVTLAHTIGNVLIQMEQNYENAR